MCRAFGMGSFATLAAGFPCFLRIEFVGCAFFVRCMTTHACYFSLLFGIHGSKATRAGTIFLTSGLGVLLISATTGMLIRTHTSISFVLSPNVCCYQLLQDKV